MIQDTSSQDTLLKPTNRMRRWKLFLLAGLILPMSLLVFAFPHINRLYESDAQLNARQLRFAVVEQGVLQRDVMSEGKIVAAVSPTFYAPAEGTVFLRVKAGDDVKLGQILAQIDSPELTNQLAVESATLDSLELEVGRQKIDTKAQLLVIRQSAEMAQVDLTAAEREMKRAELSKRDELISQVEFEQTKVALDKAKLSAAHAVQRKILEQERLEFELQTREKQFKRQQFVVTELLRQVQALTMEAPFDGIIGNVNVQQQQAVARHAPMLTVVDMSAFEAEIQIPESYADELGVGMKVEIPIEGKIHDAQLSAISPEVNNGQVSGRVQFVQTPIGLRQNQRINARILVEDKQNVVKVKRGPFVESTGGTVTYVVNNNIAVRTAIRLGAYSTGEVEVLAGLVPGDRIIISSNDSFNKNEKIYITN